MESSVENIKLKMTTAIAAACSIVAFSVGTTMFFQNNVINKIDENTRVIHEMEEELEHNHVEAVQRSQEIEKQLEELRSDTYGYIFRHRIPPLERNK